MASTLQQTIDEANREARARSRGLEACGRLPPGFTERHHPLTSSETRELNRLKMCARLAGDDANVYVALARRRPVPRARLSQNVLRLLDRWRAA